MFELIDTLDVFITAARKIGLEWLTEDYAQDGEDPEDDEEDDVDVDLSGDAKDDEPKAALLYLTMPSIQGMRRLLAMWDRYAAKASPRGDEGDWWKIFGYLARIRTWNATDRVNPTTQSFIERHLASDPFAPIRLEVDLWFRGTPEARVRARADIETIIGRLGGRLLDFVSIEQIRYQVALVEIPAAQAKSVQDRAGALANADEVMLIRPQSLYRSRPPHNVIDGDLEDLEVLQELRPAVAAVLDGYPVAQHRLLAGRLEVVEVDVKAADVPVSRRYHGTAMASLIVHGDLAIKETPITRKLISVPVLAAPQSMSDERLPSELLPIGMIYRAVHALKGGAG